MSDETVSGRITTTANRESGTVMFRGTTPPGAYEALTDAVLSAKGRDGWVEVDVEAIPPNTVIERATFSSDTGEVLNLKLHYDILRRYGHRA